MAAGIVYHNITTSAGVTYELAVWVPDTAEPNVGGVPVSRAIDENGALVDWLTPPSITLLREKTHPTTSWSYTSGATNILSNTTTAVTIKAADAALRNYVDSIQFSHTALTTACILAIRDGAGGTVLWGTQLHITTPLNLVSVTFPPGLIKSTAATLLEVVTVTANGGGTINFSAQGHVAA